MRGRMGVDVVLLWGQRVVSWLWIMGRALRAVRVVRAEAVSEGMFA